MFTHLEPIWSQSKKLPLDSKSIKSAAIDDFKCYRMTTIQEGGFDK